MGISSKKALQNLKLLQESGFIVPEKLVDLVEKQTYEDDNRVLQVWKCPKCEYEMKSEVKISSASHQCSAAKSKREILLTKVWEAPLAS